MLAEELLELLGLYAPRAAVLRVVVGAEAEDTLALADGVGLAGSPLAALFLAFTCPLALALPFGVGQRGRADRRDRPGGHAAHGGASARAVGQPCH
jgi:hypothetical protein